MLLHESILCATAPSSSGFGSGAISLHDILTGSSLTSFKQTNASQHCTCFTESRDGNGGFMLAAQPDKAIIHAYNFQKDQIASKILLPEKLSCIAIDPRGEFCAGGTAQGRMYLWEIASGILYNAWDAHYRQITVLRFTQDGVALISGSEDSAIGVWSMSRLLDDEVQNEPPTTYCTLSDHTLPVTDIVCGVGLFPSCRVLTSSADHSVKLWDLSSRTLLTTFQFPKPISSLAWDITERSFFAASPGAEGSIHQVNLFKKRQDGSASTDIEAIGGAGVTDVIRVGEENPKTRNKRLISVGQPVTALCISLTSSLLLVGTSLGIIFIYDIPSHQLLRTIFSYKDKGLSITYLTTLLKPPDLAGHISLSMSTTGGVVETIPVKPIGSFHRMRDAKTREAHEVPMILPIQASETETESPYSPTSAEFLEDHAFFVQSSAPSGTTTSLQSRVTALETEVTHLREQLAAAKGLNDSMWETVVQKVIPLAPGKERNMSATEGEDEVEPERKKKRGRL